MAWGSGGLKSCDSLLSRVEQNDPNLKEIVILPMKVFGGAEVELLASILESGKNSNLISLAASGHSLPPNAVGKLGAAIASAKSNLTSLAIGDQKMGDSGVISLCNPLECSNGGKLEVLDLAWKDISPIGMAALGKTFGHSKHLRQLDLSRNERIGNEGMKAFCEANRDDTNISVLEGLETLGLGVCNIGPIGMDALSKLIVSSPSRKLSLTLTSNPLKPDSTTFISTFLCGMSRIKSLYLAHCEIGDAGLELLTSAIQSHKCNGLVVLDLSHNGIGPEGAKNLATALWSNGESHFDSLAELVLAGNALGQDGVQRLGESLVHTQEGGDSVPGCKTIEILDLTHTSCGTFGAVAIMRSSALKRVRLFNNKLGDEGFAALANELFGGHPCIEQLDIGGNRATTIAVIKVLDAVGTITNEVDSKLNTLEVGGNETDVHVEDAIKRLKVNRPGFDVARDKPRPQENEEDE